MRCLDANVWIYYFDATLPEHDGVASAVTDVLDDDPLFTTTVLQMEVVHYVDKQARDADQLIEQFLSLEDVHVADLTATDVVRASKILQSHPESGIGGRDATVLAAMERYDVSELWTHDTGLHRVGDEINWLSVVDPVPD